MRSRMGCLLAGLVVASCVLGPSAVEAAELSAEALAVVNCLKIIKFRAVKLNQWSAKDDPSYTGYGAGTHAAPCGRFDIIIRNCGNKDLTKGMANVLLQLQWTGKPPSQNMVHSRNIYELDSRGTLEIRNHIFIYSPGSMAGLVGGAKIRASIWSNGDTYHEKTVAVESLNKYLSNSYVALNSLSLEGLEAWKFILAPRGTPCGMNLTVKNNTSLGYSPTARRIKLDRAQLTSRGWRDSGRLQINRLKGNATKVYRNRTFPYKGGKKLRVRVVSSGWNYAEKTVAMQSRKLKPGKMSKMKTGAQSTASSSRPVTRGRLTGPVSPR